MVEDGVRDQVPGIFADGSESGEAPVDEGNLTAWLADEVLGRVVIVKQVPPGRLLRAVLAQEVPAQPGNLRQRPAGEEGRLGAAERVGDGPARVGSKTMQQFLDGRQHPNSLSHAQPDRQIELPRRPDSNAEPLMSSW